MAVHKHTSWGRTRRPKNLNGASSTGEVTLVGSGDLVDALTATGAGENGYSTENQRFLHLLVGNGTANNASAAARTVTLYGYMYASGKWAPLLDEAGNAITLTAPDNNGTEALAGRKSRVFNIFGIDRIAFVGVTADTKCWAAGSTF